MPNTETEDEDYLKTIRQLAMEGANGLALGFADEIYGAGNLIGYFMAALQAGETENLLRGMGNSYIQSRDDYRQNMKEVEEKHPIAAGAVNMLGAMASPVILFSAIKNMNTIKNPFTGIIEQIPYTTSKSIASSGLRNAVTQGVLSGIGYTERNNPLDYAGNIAIGTIAGGIGNKLGNYLYGRNLQAPVQRAVINAGASKGGDIIKGYFSNESDDE